MSYFENQLRGLNVVIPILLASSEDICRDCIGLDGAKLKVFKRLKKLKIDLDTSSFSETQKPEFLTTIEHLSETCEKIDVAEDCSCQKTAGNCTIGLACLPLDGVMGLMKQIPGPNPIASKGPKQEN